MEIKYSLQFLSPAYQTHTKCFTLLSQSVLSGYYPTHKEGYTCRKYPLSLVALLKGGPIL